MLVVAMEYIADPVKDRQQGAPLVPMMLTPRHALADGVDKKDISFILDIWILMKR